MTLDDQTDATAADLVAIASRYIDDHKRKADQNERRARVSTILLTTTTALIPVTILASTQGSAFLLGKLVPFVLAAAGALVAALTQVEKPHERWMLYRRTQRVWEAELLRYEHRQGPYDAPDADPRFVGWMAEQRMVTHDSWAALVPASGQVASLARPEP